MTTMLVKHKVDDYEAWRTVFDEVRPLRAKFGCSKVRISHLAGDANALVIALDFPTLEAAQGHAGDPELQVAMKRAGVAEQPRIEFLNHTEA